MIQTHLGPWKTGKSIFEFGFDFAEIFFFYQQVRKFRAWNCKVKILSLANQNVILQIFSSIIDVFTPKRISPFCLFKSNKRPAKFSILTQCSLTPRGWRDAHRGAWLHGMMQTMKSDNSKMSRLSTLFYKKTSYHWVTYYIIFIVICILRHHREITIEKLRIKTDSAVWCTPRSFFSSIRISWRNRSQIRKYRERVHPLLRIYFNTSDQHWP